MSTSWPEHPLDEVAGYAVGALEPDDTRSATPPPAAAPSTPGDAAGGRSRAPLHLADRARRRRLVRALPAAAAAAVLVVASVAATLALTEDRDGDPPPETAEAGIEELAQAAAQGPTRLAEMASPTGEPVARLVSSDAGTYVLFDGLPPLGADRSYPLWSLDALQPVSLGVLGDGRAGAVAVAVPGSTVEVAISDAPVGGEQAPTGPIVATGSVRAA